MFAVHANPRKPRTFIPSKYTRYTVYCRHFVGVMLAWILSNERGCSGAWWCSEVEHVGATMIVLWLPLNLLGQVYTVFIIMNMHVQRYLGNPSACKQTGYSSQGPAYEQVRVDTGTGYDVIDRGDHANKPHTLTNTTVIGYWRGRTWLSCAKVYQCRGSNSCGGQEPQNYETPLRKI